MDNLIRVTVNGQTREYQKGTTYLTISRDYQAEYQDDIILVLVNKNLRELSKTAEADCELNFLTTADANGNRTYTRGMIFLLVKAVYSCVEPELIKSVRVEFSLSNGLYCELDGVTVDEELIARIKAEMSRLVAADIPFEKRSIHTDEAIALFHRYKMYDKEKLFRFRRVSKTNIYRLGGFEDYYYGYMPPSTGMLRYYDVFAYENGIILMLPYKENPRKVPDFIPRKKFYTVLQSSNTWARDLGIETVGALNEEITKGSMNDLILMQEAFQEKRIAAIAERIREEGGKKFIMIAGPSSSGKTTFSHRLSIQLKANGFKPHPIAVDDYFKNREDSPKDADGKYNFECLEAIDVELFNRDMTDLLAGKTVELPSYNFKTGRREYKGNYKTLGPDDILVIEGIHGLNDKLSHSLPMESKFKIYISALTQLNVDEHNRIATTDGRLIRRMVRDARTRGTSAKKTIEMWPSVRRGEEANIFPFQEDADEMFNSALIYELAVLKQYAEPLLFGIERDCPEYLEAKRLLKFLDYFLGVSSEEIPHNSIIREFIGGSCFKV